MIRLIALTVALALIAGCASARPKVDWRGFAQCAAAYRVNARLADPDRAATMTAMVSEVADEYEAAAVNKLRSLSDMTEAGAKSVIAGEIRAASAEFARQPREKVERFIDSCPQPDE